MNSHYSIQEVTYLDLKHMDPQYKMCLCQLHTIHIRMNISRHDPAVTFRAQDGDTQTQKRSYLRTLQTKHHDVERAGRDICVRGLNNL